MNYEEEFYALVEWFAEENRPEKYWSIFRATRALSLRRREWIRHHGGIIWWVTKLFSNPNGGTYKW